MAAGADGLISVMANAFPAKVAAMVHHIMNQQLVDALTEFRAEKAA